MVDSEGLSCPALQVRERVMVKKEGKDVTPGQVDGEGEW